MKISSLFLSAAVSIVLSATLVSTANASLQPEGTFVPALCGPQSETKSAQIQAVCIGTIVGDVSKSRVVQFRMSDETNRQFKVISQANLMMALMSGNTKSMYYLVGEEGAKATMKVIQTHDGVVASVSGQLESAEYFVPKMETMLVIQGF